MPKTTVKKPMLSNSTYDLLTRTVHYVLPGVGAFYFTLAQIWNLAYGEEVVGTAAALALLISAILKVSKNSYEKSGAAYDGALVVDTHDPMKDTITVEFDGDPLELANKDKVTFQVRGD